MQRLIKDLKPTCFEDLIALIALYRPMPLESGMVNDFIDRKHGKKKVEYPLPELEHILKETYGMILYQEQIMQIVNKLAGYTSEETNILREAMREKKEIEKQRIVFVKRSVKNGINKERAEYAFDLMAKFAEYSFDKSCAAVYAYIAYQTAYLKTHYKEYFLYATVVNETDADKVQRYLPTLTLPPHFS